MLPPYQIFDIPGGRKVALIGVVTETTPTIVAPGGVADVEFIDEAVAVNRYVPELTRRGVEAIGVLIHEGGHAERRRRREPQRLQRADRPDRGHQQPDRSTRST